ncbi:MBL fold metallo-hydrolase [Bengtsoniella intestinalis]|uniref:MBL fold metallo-hydrolase n=1 Tax=Bengtsoniella intestinalis TaxID=3073143 RepID=UPI00391F15AE
MGGFLSCNDHAKVYLRDNAFAPRFHGEPDQGGRYIGIDPAVQNHHQRFVMVDGTLSMGDGLTLFGDVEDLTGATVASASLKEQLPDGSTCADRFTHEHNLLIQEGEKTILIAGCAHCGIVNILNKAEAMVGRPVDVMVGGFHLFQLTDSSADAIIDDLGKDLKARPTQYYTGHCTGDYAYERLAEQLGSQLHRIRGGFRQHCKTPQ